MGIPLRVVRRDTLELLVRNRQLGWRWFVRASGIGLIPFMGWGRSHGCRPGQQATCAMPVRGRHAAISLTGRSSSPLRRTAKGFNVTGAWNEYWHKPQQPQPVGPGRFDICLRRPSCRSAIPSDWQRRVTRLCSRATAGRAIPTRIGRSRSSNSRCRAGPAAPLITGRQAMAGSDGEAFWIRDPRRQAEFVQRGGIGQKRLFAEV